MSPDTLRIATRKSPLAMWQANFVKQQLILAHPGLQVELIPMTTSGDVLLETSLANVGGKGLFVKELERAILENQADIAVHSIKDIPVTLPDGLDLLAICPRADPYDAFVSNQYTSLDALPHGAVVGTSSLRRQCQLRAYRPDLVIRPLRGNVNTRLMKLDTGEFAAIILATAGLERLDLASRIQCRLLPPVILPAVGQGAIGIEGRQNDTHLMALLRHLHHKNTAICIQAERAFNAQLQGGCQVPIGGFAQIEQQDQLWLRGLVGSPDGTKIIVGERRGACQQAKNIGISLANELLAGGAHAILQAVYKASSP